MSCRQHHLSYGSAVFVVLESEPLIITVQNRQPLANIGETDLQHLSIDMCANQNRPSRCTACKTVMYRILYERLQNETWHHAVMRVARDLTLNAEPIRKTQSLDLDVWLDFSHLHAKTHLD